MKTFYPCTIKEEDSTFYVNFPDFEDCFTDGDTMEEAVANAKDVLEAVAFSYLITGLCQSQVRWKQMLCI